MADFDTITLVGKYGTFQTRPAVLDLMIERYLPASLRELRAVVEEKGGLSVEVHTVADALMVLAELDGYATN